MKSPQRQSDWHDLVHRARRDLAPSLDVAALQRVVTAEWQAQCRATRDWRAQLLQLCDVTRALRWCVGGLALSATVTGWQLWQAWQDLAWAHYAGLGMGGGW